MSALATPPDLNPARTARERRRRLNRADLRGNRILKVTALVGGAIVFIGLVAVVVQIVSGASGAFSKFGIGFVGHQDWVPSLDHYGAAQFLFGSVVTAVLGTIGGAVIGVSIGLFLALLAPRRVAMVVGPLVEMLAAIPSVVLGLIGIYLIAPFVRSDMEGWLHSVFGWTGLFGEARPVGNSLFCAALVLVIMTVPIIAALTRDTFLTVPRELRDGAEALGATRWEMIRGVVLPTTRSGVMAAVVLGFARAVEEAIAVQQVVGGNIIGGIHADLFGGGDTMAALIAGEFGDPQDNLNISSLYYLAVILLVIGIINNLLARRLVLGGRKARRA